ncbi:translocation/assembly module TamB domain-containing protein [Fodinibius saliphilus]|uniref:translocation/assembly module TamB domain-containing protein n=1 Tax=Fodinibius saliphilus TaxID=1920650 RepID=UPI001107D575|nr:translocation/assembly module TamB [Fodinibius saliphilus]
MTEESIRHSSFKKWGKRLLWCLLGVGVCLLLARLSLKTKIVQNWVKDTVRHSVNENIDGQLVIGNLSGDLWNHLSISEISLTQGEDTLVNVDSLTISYNIWPLVGGKVDVDRLDIFRPTIGLEEKSGRWNIQSIVKESPDTASGSTGWAIGVRSFKLHNGLVSVTSDSLLPVDGFTIKEWEIASSFEYGESYNIDLQNLSFKLYEKRLSGPVQLTTVASADKEKLTLEKLVMATGRSMIEGRASVSTQDSSGQLSVDASPVSWEDIMAYAEEIPVRKDMRVNIGVKGSKGQFRSTLNVHAPGLEKFALTSQLHWDEGLVLEELSTEIKHFDPVILLADTTLPALAQFNARFNGQFPLADYRNSYGAFQISGHDVNYASYNIDQFNGEGKVDDAKATFDLELNAGQQQLDASVTSEQLWSDYPMVGAQIRAERFNPGYWAEDSTYGGRLSFTTEVSGRGWYPQQNPWSYALTINKSRLMGQPISEGTMKGKISSEEISLDSQFDIRKGMLEVMAKVKNLHQIPSFSYELESRDLDVAALMGIEDFKTAINAVVTGKGQGKDIPNLSLNSTVDIDSSLVNGELLRSFSSHITLDDSIAVIDSARLQSTIAEGTLKGQMNILKRYDAQNELTLDLQLKDVKSLAPLVDVEELGVKGQVTGRLRPINGNGLEFRGAFDFANLTYGQVFAADRAKGALNTRILKALEYKLNIDLETPIFSGVKVQDLELQSRGAYSEFSANGQFDLQFSSPNEGRIEHSGDYRIETDSIRVRTREYNIISDYRILSLENSFDMTLTGDTFRMERMRVSSGDGAFFEMAIPVLNANEQEAVIHGEALNTAVVQSCLLDKTLIKGMLSGRMEFSRNDTALNAQGELVLSDVEYKETRFDTLLLQGNIANQRLKGDLSVKHDQQELITGQANLPFKLGNPEKLTDRFFEEPVHGSIQVRKISIDRFKSIFAEVGVTNTTGLFSFRGTLDGKAGDPRFVADATLSKATLSGVSVDSVTAGFDYNHAVEEVELDASVLSLGQKAADIKSEVPFYINLRTFELGLPAKQDSIFVDIETNDFNLAAVNDFLDRRRVRKVKGRLNGAVQFSGSIGDLKTDGELVFDNGALQLVPAGIKVKNVQAALDFESDHVQLKEFSADSDNGTMTASGKVGLRNMEPGALDIDLRAKNFRIANTDQYNAVINLDANAGGKVSQPKMSGDLSFVSGFLKLNNFGEKSVETVQLDTLDQPAVNVNMYDSLALDMNISFDRRFYIRNNRYLEMEVELNGALDLVKEKAEDLELFGTIRTPGGYARPFGKRFNLEEGSVVFSGDPTNPKLSIRTRYQPPQTQEDITIWYIIEGTVENPKFKYESRPTMQLENIISYTIFGQPFYALNSWKQVVAGSGNNSAANVALDVLLDRVEALATQKLGIDVVKIDNIQVGEESGTQITTGWYLNPKVFLAIQNVITGSTPDTSFLLEYMLRKDLKLLIRQGNGIRQGVDIKWNYDY